MIFISLILSIAITLFLVNKKINIGYSLITGAIILALLNGKGIKYVFATLLKTLTDPTTISLAAIIALITILGHLMEKYLILDRMINSLEKMLRSAKLTILIAPAIIGTLLVTGGALMSCPVVQVLGDKLGIPNHKRATINLIFRHALYFIFPLAPTIMLASEIGGFNIWDFVKLQLPIALAMYILGYIFFVRGYSEQKAEKIGFKQYLKSIAEFLLYSSPIVVSLLGVVLLKLPFYISLLFGITISILINQYDIRHDNKYKVEENVFKTMYKGIKPAMVIAILGIMVYKNVVNDIDQIFVQLNAMLDKGMPIELLIFIACAMISFPLASTQPGIAILFPMILPLAPDYDTKLLYAMFIYTSAFMFYYISPLHLCQVLTLEYFEVNVKKLYKNYIFILPLIYLVMVTVYIINIV
ncbi:DUF401 family protein [Brassicibacter mesophilus]|uniref:DUF401 family protein n=1 Tax=Brassicibacter mesophilus TaxID=745119 RepID=UPI003D19EBDA